MGHETAHHVGLHLSVTLAVMIGVIGIFNWSKLYISWRPRKFTGFTRSIAYYPVWGLEVGLGSVLMLLLVPVAFFIYLLTFKPYYEPLDEEYEVSPLGLRFGWTAISSLPFLFCFANRINPITVVARISPERWMFFHKWGARIMWFFTVVHIIVCFHGQLRYGGFALIKSWYRDHARLGYFFAGGKGRYLNGTVAFIALTLNVFVSMKPLRRRFYEVFVIQHVCLVIVMVIALFPHVTKTKVKLGRNNMWACVAVWAFGAFFRLFYNGLSALRMGKYRGKGRVTVVGSATVLDIELCGQSGDSERSGLLQEWMAWKPGQYCHLRFPELAPFQSHPFTLAAKPTPTSFRFVIASRKGITAKLAKTAMKKPDRPLDVFLEGPYGAIREKLERFDKVLIIVGGVGSTFGVGVLAQLQDMDIERRMVWCTRTTENIEWFDLDERARRDVDIYVTGAEGFASISTSADNTAASSSTRLDEIVPLPREQADAELELTPVPSKDKEDRSVPKAGGSFNGRPDIDGMISEWVETSRVGARFAVIVCGPHEMSVEVSRTVARLEWEISRGQSRASEIWLHREVFGW